MAKAVMMCGIAGSGKTTRAMQLESEGFVRLSVDEAVWNRYGLDTYESLPSNEKMEATRQIEADLLDEMKMHLQSGRNVVFDSTMCKRAKRNRFREAAGSVGGTVILEYLDVDKATLRNRLRKRYGNPGPNAFPVSDEELDMFWKGFERPDADELALNP